MVTQVASTAAGICELIVSGFIGTLVRDLWTLLDGGEDDYRLTAPRTHPLDPMDRTAHKVCLCVCVCVCVCVTCTVLLCVHKICTVVYVVVSKLFI